MTQPNGCDDNIYSVWEYSLHGLTTYVTKVFVKVTMSFLLWTYSTRVRHNSEGGPYHSEGGLATIPKAVRTIRKAVSTTIPKAIARSPQFRRRSVPFGRRSQPLWRSLVHSASPYQAKHVAHAFTTVRACAASWSDRPIDRIWYTVYPVPGTHTVTHLTVLRASEALSTRAS